MARKPFIAGNWKMNQGAGEAKKLIEALKPLVSGINNVQVAVCPPYTSLESAKAALAGSAIELGAQNTMAAAKDGKIITTGAYTGEIGPAMLKEAGVQWVILGHSERRQYFNETDDKVNVKITAVFEAGMRPIICVGETLAEREQNITEKVVETQVRGCFNNIPADRAKECVIAYEPVWAIGTGKTATPEQAQEVHAFIRNLLVKLYNREVADAIRIQYGGSMNEKNAAELLAKPDIDGGLIGGASLKADAFAAIVKAAS